MLEFERRSNLITDDDVLARSKEFSISPLIVRLMNGRGINGKNKIHAFLNPDVGQLLNPFTLPDMEKAVKRIENAIVAAESIFVYGDYDVDGVCATSMLVMYLKKRGANVSYYVPSRQGDGYGMSCDAVNKLSERGARLIITVDNGISALNEVELCNSLGIDVIVTDHHTPQDLLPECVAVVAASRKDSLYENKLLCGAGVVFKLICALDECENVMEYLPLVGLATVADIVELTGENRVLVSLALSMINDGKCPIGMNALIAVTHKNDKPITSYDLAFTLAPRINAAGRMDDATIAIELMCQGDKATALDMALRLNELNRQRQADEATILDNACEMLASINVSQLRAIVLHHSSWSHGILGIVASRLVEKYKRPVLLFGGENVATGSARSIPGIDIFKSLQAHSGYFSRYGGHAGAAGITMQVADISSFGLALNDYLRKSYSYKAFIPKLFYDEEADFCDISREMISEMELLAPFGQGNERPVLLTDDVRFTELKRIGSDLSHLRATACKDKKCFDVIAFGRGADIDSLSPYTAYKMLYKPSLNTFKDKTKVQLELIEAKPSQIDTSVLGENTAEDKFFDAFLQNVLYNSDCNTSSYTVAADNSTLKSMLSNDIMGSLIVCFDEPGARKALLDINALELDDNIDMSFFSLSQGGYNTILMAPVIEQLGSTGFTNVLVYGNAGDGILQELKRRTCYGTMYVYPFMPEYMKDLLNIDRDVCLVHYKALLAGKTATSGAIESVVVDELQCKTGDSHRVCAFVIKVFLELGLLEICGHDALKIVIPPQKCQLGDSKTYIGLMNLKKHWKLGDEKHD